MAEKLIGKVTHYFDKISVAAVILGGELKVGDELHIIGHGADFNQTVDSMQIEGKNVVKAKKGDEIGIRIAGKAKPGTEVYLVQE